MAERYQRDNAVDEAFATGWSVGTANKDLAQSTFNQLPLQTIVRKTIRMNIPLHILHGEYRRISLDDSMPEPGP
jgi:hypothetical protein